MPLSLLNADAEDLGRAITADLVAHARTAEHARLHVLLVAALEQHLDDEVDREADRDRRRVDTDDSVEPGAGRLTRARTRLEGGEGGLHAGKHAFGDRDLRAERRERRAHPVLDDLALVLAAILESIEQTRRSAAQRPTGEYLDMIEAVPLSIHAAVIGNTGIVDHRIGLDRVGTGVDAAVRRAGRRTAGGRRLTGILCAQRTGIGTRGGHGAGNCLDRALPAAACRCRTTRGLAFIGGITIAVEVNRAHLARGCWCGAGRDCWPSRVRWIDLLGRNGSGNGVVLERHDALLRIRCRLTAHDRPRRHEQQGSLQKQAGHGVALVQVMSAPPSLTVCIITTASGKSSRQPQAETICSPGPVGQTLSAEQTW